jgi:hypothetical protein
MYCTSILYCMYCTYYTVHKKRYGNPAKCYITARYCTWYIQVVHTSPNPMKRLSNPSDRKLTMITRHLYFLKRTCLKLNRLCSISPLKQWSKFVKYSLDPSLLLGMTAQLFSSELTSLIHETKRRNPDLRNVSHRRRCLEVAESIGRRKVSKWTESAYSQHGGSIGSM